MLTGRENAAEFVRSCAPVTGVIITVITAHCSTAAAASPQVRKHRQDFTPKNHSHELQAV